MGRVGNGGPQVWGMNSIHIYVCIYIYIGISFPHSLQVAAWGGSDLLAIQDIHVLYSIPKNC